jgi:hypothetical protein
MPEMDVVLSTKSSPGGGRSDGGRSVSYEQFRQMAWAASRRITAGDPRRRGVVPIPRLRRALRRVPEQTFAIHLLRMEQNGLVYLIPPENPAALGEEERRRCVAHANGGLRSFVLWMNPRTRAATTWD